MFKSLGLKASVLAVAGCAAFSSSAFAAAPVSSYSTAGTTAAAGNGEQQKLGLAALGAFTQSMVSDLTRRDYAVDSALTTATQDTYYQWGYNNASGTAFVKPYYAKDSFEFDGQGASTDIGLNTVGVLASIHSMNTWGLLSGFAGYEHVSGTNDVAGYSTKLNMDTFYVGVRYTNIFYSSRDFEAYYKGTGKLAYSNASLDMTKASASKIEAHDIGTVAYAANASVGLNWRLPHNGRLSPEIGAGVNAGSMENFAIDSGLGGGYFRAKTLTMPWIEANITWVQKWTEPMRTVIGGGVRKMFNTDINSTLENIGGTNGGTTNQDVTFQGADQYEYVEASVIYDVNRSIDVAVGYTGVFDEYGTSHNGHVRFEYKF